MENNIVNALMLTLFAGLSTCIGSFIAFFTKHTNTKILSLSLGLSAGVMIYVSFVELFVQSQQIFTNSHGFKLGMLFANACFFIGMFFIGIIDRLVPSGENPHEIKTVEDLENKNNKLMHLGIISVIAIGIHNFPEGIATFIAAYEAPSLGIAIAAAIAIHNIPEGIAVSVPVYQATGNKRKAFIYSLVSGLAEPIGALIAFLILKPFISQELLAGIFAFVAGIMIFISLDELLPAARKYGEHHLSIYGLLIGMAVMAASITLLG